MTEPVMGLDLDALGNLGKVSQTMEAAEELREPSGELEAALRKPGASGTLVRMANGDVVYVPTVEYSTEYYTAADGEPDVRFTQRSKFHPALVEALKKRGELVGTEDFDLRFFVKLLLEVLRENYPALTAEQMGEWLGDLPQSPDAQNRVVTEIFVALDGLGKK